MKSFKKLSLSPCFFLVLLGLGFSFVKADSLPPTMNGISVDIGGINMDEVRFYYKGNIFSGDNTMIHDKFKELIVDPRGYVIIVIRGVEGNYASLYGIQWLGDDKTRIVFPSIYDVCVYTVFDGKLDVAGIEYTERGVLIKFRSGMKRLSDGMGEYHSALFYRISDNKWFFFGKSRVDAVIGKTSSEVSTTPSCGYKPFVIPLDHITK